MSKVDNTLLKQLVVASSDSNEDVRAKAFQELLVAMELPMREAVFDGNILFDIYNKIDTPGESTPRFPLHPVEPGTEAEFGAYTIPHCGGIPQRTLNGDELLLHTYKVGNSVDVCLDYIEKGRFDVYQAAMDTYRAGFVMKMNTDGWRAILAACKARNVIVTDPAAAAGALTKRLLSSLKTFMERNGGGNSASMNGSKLTDVYISLEADADIRNWNVDQLDEITLREVHQNGGRLSRLFGMNIHALHELGVGQAFQTYAVNTLGVTMPGTDVELVVGLDQSSDNSFLMPVSKGLQTFVDPTLHRLQKWGVYGWMNLGFGVTDVRKCVFGAL